VAVIITDSNRDYYAGALMALIGAGTAYQGSQYGIGSLAEMESGFFPTVLGVGLVVIGALIAANASKADAATTGQENPQHAGPAAMDWRAWIAIILGVSLFMLCSEYLGLLPAIFSSVFVSAIGSRVTTLKQALVLACCVTVFGVLLFGYGLKVQIPTLRGF
jgi:hypothetical protein